MVNNAYDLLIVGGGLSGLLLAFFLTQRDPDLNFKILEQREDYTHDRHWGVWLEKNHQDLLKDVIATSYGSWSVISRDKERCDKYSDEYRYCVIRSGDFYAFMQKQLFDNIEYGVTCQNVRDHEVITDDGIYKASMIVDARPADIAECKIFQQFSGWVVETKDPVFTKDSSALDSMTLMDFSVKQDPDGCGFMYVLPFSPHKALVEPTVFTSALLEPEYFEKQKKQYLENLGAVSWTVIEQEKAVLPMAVQSRAQILNDIFPIGRRGGWMRASSGYAFYTSLILSRELADHIAAHRALPKKPLKPFGSFSLMLDRVYLRVLERAPDIMPAVFHSWFDKMSAEEMVSFLNNKAHFMTYLRLFIHTPYKKQFMRAIWRI